MRTCELRKQAEKHEYGPCGGPLARHHIVSKNDLMKNKAGRHMVDKTFAFEEDRNGAPGLFLAYVCHHHNSDTKFADLPAARDFLLEKRYNQFGREFLEAVTDLCLTFTDIPYYLRPYLEAEDE